MSSSVSNGCRDWSGVHPVLDSRHVWNSARRADWCCHTIQFKLLFSHVCQWNAMWQTVSKQALTGLTIWHTDEHFQCSNEMISVGCLEYPLQTHFTQHMSTFLTWTDSPQPQNVAILWVCSRCSRWHSYLMFASIVQLTIILKLKGLYVPELSICL